MTIAPGDTFGRYEIETLVGRGGMGEVYRARDPKLKRTVALKVLAPGGDADGAARLIREAHAAAAITHPNAVAIYDLGETDGTGFIVMEYVTGKSLLEHVGDDATPLATKVRWLVDVARALGAAHRAGVVHRDVKPSNVMVSSDGVVKVLDFGLARPSDPMSFRTQEGFVAGTPRYMAPELFTGETAGPRADQYAFGVTAYELLGGAHPGPPGGGPRARLEELAPAVPAALARVVERTLSSVPEERFASMDDVAVALEKTARAPTEPSHDDADAHAPPADAKTMREVKTAREAKRSAPIAFAATEVAPKTAPTTRAFAFIALFATVALAYPVKLALDEVLAPGPAASPSATGASSTAALSPTAAESVSPDPAATVPEPADAATFDDAATPDDAATDAATDVYGSPAAAPASSADCTLEERDPFTGRCSPGAPKLAAPPPAETVR